MPPANQRRGVNWPIPVEPRFTHDFFQPPQLGVDGLVLVVNNKAHNIEGTVSSERPEISRLVDENAQLAHYIPSPQYDAEN